VINTVKVAQRVWAGTLTPPMLKLGGAYGGLAMMGVLGSTLVIPRMSKSLFMKLEYAVMTFAAAKLLDAGLGTGLFG